jgi:DNA-binding IclR family transcriptional regulator
LSASAKSDSGQRTSRTTARSVGQTLALLELLVSSDRPLGVTEVAERLGFSNAGAHRLLAALQEREYARQDPHTGKYLAGLACFRLGTLSRTRRGLRDAAQPRLARLNEATLETVHLAVYEAGSVVYIDKVESRHEVAPVSRVGTKAPAHAVATGLAILAYQPLSEVEAAVQRGLERYTDATVTDGDALAAELDRTRRRGYAINRGAWRAGVGGVASPIRDYSGTVQASVGCCMPLERMTDEALPAIAERTLAEASAISAELGFVLPAN